MNANKNLNFAIKRNDLVAHIDNRINLYFEAFKRSKIEDDKIEQSFRERLKQYDIDMKKWREEEKNSWTIMPFIPSRSQKLEIDLIVCAKRLRFFNFVKSNLVKKETYFLTLEECKQLELIW